MPAWPTFSTRSTARPAPISHSRRRSPGTDCRQYRPAAPPRSPGFAAQWLPLQLHHGRFGERARKTEERDPHLSRRRRSVATRHPSPAPPVTQSEPEAEPNLVQKPNPTRSQPAPEPQPEMQPPEGQASRKLPRPAVEYAGCLWSSCGCERLARRGDEATCRPCLAKSLCLLMNNRTGMGETPPPETAVPPAAGLQPATFMITPSICPFQACCRQTFCVIPSCKKPTIVPVPVHARRAQIHSSGLW